MATNNTLMYLAGGVVVAAVAVYLYLNQTTPCPDPGNCPTGTAWSTVTCTCQSTSIGDGNCNNPAQVEVCIQSDSSGCTQYQCAYPVGYNYVGPGTYATVGSGGGWTAVLSIADCTSYNSYQSQGAFGSTSTAANCGAILTPTLIANRHLVSGIATMTVSLSGGSPNSTANFYAGSTATVDSSQTNVYSTTTDANGDVAKYDIPITTIVADLGASANSAYIVAYVAGGESNVVAVSLKAQNYQVSATTKYQGKANEYFDIEISGGPANAQYGVYFSNSSNVSNNGSFPAVGTGTLSAQGYVDLQITYPNAKSGCTCSFTTSGKIYFYVSVGGESDTIVSTAV